MKKIIAIVSLLLVFCVLSSCSSCSSCGKKLEPVSDGGLYDKKTGVTYSVAPACYEAMSWEKELYMEDTHGTGYYRVKDENGTFSDPPKYLYNYDYNILLYNSKEVTLPTLEEMNPDSLSIYMESTSKVYMAVEEDADVVKEALKIFDGPSMRFNGSAAEDKYKISFSSPDHPFVYVVSYLEYSTDQYEYVSLKDRNFSSVSEIEENYDFVDGVAYEIITEDDGSYTVKYNYGKYFIYIREEGRCYMAEFIYDKYNNPNNVNDTEESV